jgi:ribonuclease BN (tRNA processing enzyme)
MNVNLTVIGSSPAWPNPGSAHAGYLLDGPGRLLLDCGPGVLARLRTDGLLDVDAILISHFHLDHWGDLVPWVWMPKHLDGGRRRRPVLWLPPSGSRDLEHFAVGWGHAGMFEEAFRVREYRSGVPFTTAGFGVTAIPVDHYGIEAFGFRVRDPAGRVLAYSGDSAPCEELYALAKDADLFLCEATLAEGADDPVPRGHLSADEALALGNARTLLTHRPAELPTPSGVERAVDGLVLEV